jgi:hypothetical protein
MNKYLSIGLVTLLLFFFGSSLVSSASEVGDGVLTITSPENNTSISLSTTTEVTVSWSWTGAETNFLLRAQDTTDPSQNTITKYGERYYIFNNTYTSNSVTFPVLKGHSYDFWMNTGTEATYSPTNPYAAVSFEILNDYPQSTDTTAPVITILGENPMYVELGTTFTDPGATSLDEGSIGIVNATGTVDTSTVGTYTIIYTSSDASDNISTSTREVVVRDAVTGTSTDTTAPVITIIGENPMYVELGTTFTDPGATALDNASSTTVNATGTVDTSTIGTYTIIYTSSDASDNISTSTREVIVRNTVVLGTDASLISLSTSLGTLTPTFSSSTLNYTVELPQGTTDIPTVSATTTDPLATSTITQAVSITSATSSDRTATVVVKSEDQGERMVENIYSVIFSVATSTEPIINPPTPSNNNGGGSSGGSYYPGFERLFLGFQAPQTGSVLGASTETVTPITAPVCELFKSSMRKGMNNDRNEVIKLQKFLNEELDTNLPLTGFFGSLTEKAVKNFQMKYRSIILDPWVNAGTMKKATATGYFFKTTQYAANKILCPDEVLEAPAVR